MEAVEMIEGELVFFSFHSFDLPTFWQLQLCVSKFHC